MSKKMYIGVDVGGTKILAAVVQEDGKVLKRCKAATPRDVPADDIVAQIKTLIHDLLDSQDLKGHILSGIGVGIPGLVAPNQQDIIHTPNTNLSAYPLGKFLKKTFNTKTVLGNDVNLGLLGEVWLGAGQGMKHVLGLFPGTGVGGGIVINEKLYMGAQGAAGEIGHMIMDRKSPYQSAGIFGSLEALASRSAVENRIREYLDKGETSIVTDLTNGDLALIKSKILSKALDEKDKVVMRVMDEVCDVIGTACISLRHILNPEMIILGGGVLEACGSYMLPRIRAVSDADPFFAGFDYCQIVRSRLEDDAVVLGAVALVKDDGGEIKIRSNALYPKVAFKADGLEVDGQIYPGSVYVRADGKVKIMADKEAFAEALETHILDLTAVKKICKANPHVLFIGTGLKEFAITPVAEEWLASNGVACVRLSIAEAIKQYEQAKRRKALLIWCPSS